MLNDIEIKNLEELCKENRLNVLKMVYNAQSGHLGGALSAVEIMTVLYNKVMKTCKKWGEGEDFENRDRFVLSKGHASAILYSVLSQVGYIKKMNLWDLEFSVLVCKVIHAQFVMVLKLQVVL